MNGLDDMEEMLMDIFTGIIKVDGNWMDIVDGSDIYAGRKYAEATSDGN